MSWGSGSRKSTTASSRAALAEAADLVDYFKGQNPVLASGDALLPSFLAQTEDR